MPKTPEELLAEAQNSAASDPTNPVGNGDETFSKADLIAAIEKARKEEKDKVYGKIESLTSQMNEWKSKDDARAQAEAEAKKAQEDAARQSREAEMTAKDLLAERERQWGEQLNELTTGFEERLNTLQSEREQERALLEKEKEFASLQAHIQRRISEEQNTIAPELIDLVTGNTPDEVEHSIALLKQKSNAIAEAVKAATQARGVGRTTSVTNPPVGPMDYQFGEQKYSPEDIRNMPMTEWAKMRGKFGVGGGSNNTGLFG